MPQDEPTLGEVLRRIDALVDQVTTLASEMKDDRRESAKTFVRQDVYIAQRLADQAVVSDLHGDLATVKAERQKDLEWRRQINLTLAAITITALVSIAIAIATILTR